MRDRGCYVIGDKRKNSSQSRFKTVIELLKWGTKGDSLKPSVPKISTFNCFCDAAFMYENTLSGFICKVVSE